MGKIDKNITIELDELLDGLKDESSGHIHKEPGIPLVISEQEKMGLMYSNTICEGSNGIVEAIYTNDEFFVKRNNVKPYLKKFNINSIELTCNESYDILPNYFTIDFLDTIYDQIETISFETIEKTKNAQFKKSKKINKSELESINRHLLIQMIYKSLTDGDEEKLNKIKDLYLYLHKKDATILALLADGYLELGNIEEGFDFFVQSIDANKGLNNCSIEVVINLLKLECSGQLVGKTINGKTILKYCIDELLEFGNIYDDKKAYLMLSHVCYLILGEDYSFIGDDMYDSSYIQEHTTQTHNKIQNKETIDVDYNNCYDIQKKLLMNMYKVDQSSAIGVLGMFHLSNCSTTVGIKLLLEGYRKYGYNECFYIIGNHLSNLEDNNRALSFYKIGAKLGDHRCSIELINIYDSKIIDGKDVYQDLNFKKAVYYYEKLALERLAPTGEKYDKYIKTFEQRYILETNIIKKNRLAFELFFGLKKHEYVTDGLKILIDVANNYKSLDQKTLHNFIGGFMSEVNLDKYTTRLNKLNDQVVNEAIAIGITRISKFVCGQASIGMISKENINNYYQELVNYGDEKLIGEFEYTLLKSIESYLIDEDEDYDPVSHQSSIDHVVNYLEYNEDEYQKNKQLSVEEGKELVKYLTKKKCGSKISEIENVFGLLKFDFNLSSAISTLSAHGKMNLADLFLDKSFSRSKLIELTKKYQEIPEIICSIITLSISNFTYNKSFDISQTLTILSKKGIPEGVYINLIGFLNKSNCKINYKLLKFLSKLYNKSYSIGLRNEIISYIANNLNNYSNKNIQLLNPIIESHKKTSDIGIIYDKIGLKNIAKEIFEGCSKDSNYYLYESQKVLNYGPVKNYLGAIKVLKIGLDNGIKSLSLVVSSFYGKLMDYENQKKYLLMAYNNDIPGSKYEIYKFGIEYKLLNEPSILKVTNEYIFDNIINTEIALSGFTQLKEIKNNLSSVHMQGLNEYKNKFNDLNFCIDNIGPLTNMIYLTGSRTLCNQLTKAITYILKLVKNTKDREIIDKDYRNRSSFVSLLDYLDIHNLNNFSETYISFSILNGNFINLINGTIKLFSEKEKQSYLNEIYLALRGTDFKVEISKIEQKLGITKEDIHNINMGERLSYLNYDQSQTIH